MIIDNNKRRLEFNKKEEAAIQSPLKRVKIEEIAWLTARDCIQAVARRKLEGELSSLPTAVHLSSLKALDIPFSERIERLLGSMTKTERCWSMWLEIQENLNVFVRIHTKNKHDSFFDIEEARSKVLGLKKEVFDISIFTEGQQELVCQKKDELEEPLKGEMTKPYWPLISLKADAEGKTLEVVWIQGARGFHGARLREITELFIHLLAPSQKVYLGDQATKNGYLIRQFYPLIKSPEELIAGPGYYGSWGFVPANLWRMRPTHGAPVSQSRNLYYAAVQHLRNLTLEKARIILHDKQSKEAFAMMAKHYGLKPDAPFYQLMKTIYEAMVYHQSERGKQDFEWLVRNLLTPYPMRLNQTTGKRHFELALRVIIDTEIWEMGSCEDGSRGYLAYLLLSSEPFETLVRKVKNPSPIIKKMFGNPTFGESFWLD